MIWKLRTQKLDCSKFPHLMGIVNLTPDSFSDGGRFYQQGKLDISAATDYALKLVEDGADILDLGAESTRPGAKPIGTEEELRRLIPVVAAVHEKTSVPISVDTYRADVAREAVAAGAEIINDISAATYDPDMARVLVEMEVGVCLMHAQGTPDVMQQTPHYENVVTEVADYLSKRKAKLIASGMDSERIALDPGIGFGKTAEHNRKLLQEVETLRQLGSPLLYGVSRKRFIDDLTGMKHTNAKKRLPGTIAVCLWLTHLQVSILRVHDVAEVLQGMKIFRALEIFQ